MSDGSQLRLEPIKYLAFDARIPIDKQVTIWRDSRYALGVKWMASLGELRVLDRDGQLLWKKDATPEDCYFETPEQSLAAVGRNVEMAGAYGGDI